MSITADPAQSHSRDVAIAAIAEAIEQVGHADDRPAPADPPLFEGEQGTAQDPFRPPGPPIGSPRSPLRTLAYWSLIGLLATICIWIASFVWQSADGYAPAIQWMAERLSISPAPAEKKPELAGQTVQSSDETKTITFVSQPPPKAEREASPVAPMSPELMQWIQTIVRELANLEHGIEQLKADQAQLARDTAEHLKEMQDQTARHNADLIETLKAEQSQMIRDSMNTGQQLKASQEQVAIIGEKIKAIQEQLDRLVASDQQPRPKTLAPPQRPIVAPTPKPVLPPAAHL
jgi:hypothetical protein